MGKLKTFKPSWIPPRLPPRVPSAHPARKADLAPVLPPNFYQSKAWHDARALKLASDPVCQPCLLRGVARLAEVVHHLEPVETHPELALDQANLESACKPCHNRSHPEKGGRRPAPGG